MTKGIPTSSTGKSQTKLIIPRILCKFAIPKYIIEYGTSIEYLQHRLRAKAGLTGLAQIYGKYNTSPRDKLIMDLAYIQQYSVWLDLKLILRTALVLLTPEESTEAFEDKKTEEKA